MKSKIYLLFFCLLSMTTMLDAQRQTFFQSNPADNGVMDCFNFGPKSYEMEVTGLPTSGWTTNFLHVNMSAEFPDELIVEAITPQGTSILLSNSFDGSWPNGTGLYYFKSCPSLPAHNAPPLMDGPFNWSQPAIGSNFPDLSGEDLNGTWTFEVCGVGNVGIWFLELDFTTVNPEIAFFPTELAADCQSTTKYDRQVTLPPCETGFEYRETNNYSYNVNDPYTINFPFEQPVYNWDDELFPNLYFYEIVGANSGSYTTDYIVEAADYSTAGAVMNCPDDVTVNPGEYDISQALFSRNCDVFAKMELEIIDPDGNVAYSADPWNTFDWFGGVRIPLDYSMEGVYEMNWSLLMDEIDNLGNPYWTQCQQRITINPNATTTFESPVCQQWEAVNADCAVGPTRYPLEVSGQPILDGNYNLLNLHLSFTVFNADFFANVKLVDPQGNIYPILDGNSLPAFDNNLNPTVLIDVSTCRSSSILSVNDPNAANFGQYRVDGNFPEVNETLIDPNGTWFLEVCKEDPIPPLNINCFSLDFGPVIPALLDYTIIDDDCDSNPTNKLTVDRSQILENFCDDIDNDGFPDYFVAIDGGIANGWNLMDDKITVDIPAGAHTLTFGRITFDFFTGFEIRYHETTIDVTFPAIVNDTELPSVTNCPANRTVQIGANGEVQTTLLLPNVSDNCTIKDSLADIRWAGGATAPNGNTENLNFDLSGTMRTDIKLTTQGTGTVTVDWKFGDTAGNVNTTCKTVVTIQNNDPCINDTEIPSVTNCPANRTVMLGANGEVETPLSLPNVGDNCAVKDSLADIRWAGGATAPNGNTENLNFDLSGRTQIRLFTKGTGTVTVDWKFNDAANNINTSCKTVVTIQANDPCVNDMVNPTLTNCPADMTVNLNSNGTLTANIMTPNTADNCAVTSRLADLIYTDGATGPNNEPQILNAPFDPGINGEYDVKGAGKLTITWKAGDAAGNTGTCKTVITSIINDPCSSDTEAPKLNNCPQNVAIVLDANGDGIFSIVDPSVTDNCDINSTELKMTYMGGATDENGMTSYTTMMLSSTPVLYRVKNAGTIEIEYTAIDDAGNISKCNTTITAVGASGPCMNDVTLPTVTNCPDDRTVELVNGEALIEFDRPEFTDNCAIENVTFRARFRNGATGPNGNTDFAGVAPNGGQAAIPVNGAGVLTLDYTGTDPSGNQVTCSFVYRTVIPGTDALFNIASACAVAGQNLSLPVTVTRFNSIGAFSFDLEVPANSGLSFVGLENRALDNASFNVLGNGDLRVSWDEPSGNNLTLDDNYKVFNVVLSASASFSQPSTVSGKDLVILSDVNDVGSFDVGNVCVGASVSPVGQILSPLGKPQADVAVNLVSGSNFVGSTTTNALGSYTFDNTNDNYRIRPSKNDEVRKGVTIIDVARIRRHFLQKLLLDDDYKLVAADVNKDGRINVLDVAFTNRVFLRKLDAFPKNTAWRYLPAALDISAKPLDINLPEQINLLAPNLDYSKLDFVSIKTGDVDHSALENFRGNDDTNNRMDVTITIPDTVLAPQQEVMIPVNLAGSEKVSALSFVLKYDAEVLTLKSISAPSLPGFNAGSYNDIDGEVIIGWDHKDGDDVNAEGVLMMMTFESKVEEGMSDLVIEEASAFDINLEGINVTSTSGSINFMTSSVEDLADVVSIKATPNPFIDQFNLNVETATAQNLKVVIRDVNGQTIYTTTTTRKTTQHNLVIDNIEATGVLLVTVEGESFVKTMKMIKM